MEAKKSVFDLAIIGCGPRGLSALESFYREVSKGNPLFTTIIFEATDDLGAGPVYALNQADTNWLNVSKRALDIDSRQKIDFQDFTIPRFPTYQEWSGFDLEIHQSQDPDEFPLRSDIGRYLKERFESIANPLIEHHLIQVVKGEVSDIEFERIPQMIKVDDERYYCKEAAICIGHQPVTLDKQLQTWKEFVSENSGITLFTVPYPVHRIINNVKSHKRVAIRGFGLAAIDVIRGLTIGRGGTFSKAKDSSETMIYKKSGKEPQALVPFSLNGLPMIPKPLNQEIDEWFKPNDRQLQDYEKAVIEKLQSTHPPKDTNFLINAITPIIALIYLSLEGEALKPHKSLRSLETIISKWLLNEEYEHPLITSKKQDPILMMQEFSRMACGETALSLDFCIGNVWRHCQPTMYRLLSFAPLTNDVIAMIIELDERLKRYTYGPPVNSIKQLIALYNCNILRLDFLEDPQIEINEKGWCFISGNQEIETDLMINSVLDAPQILKVTTPLAKNIISKPRVEPITGELGIDITDDLLVDVKASTEAHIAVIGRLAKGTLIGVDAIAECFGERSRIWAKNTNVRLHEMRNE